jgi:hypothetical protein
MPMESGMRIVGQGSYDALNRRMNPSGVTEPFSKQMTVSQRNRPFLL